MHSKELRLIESAIELFATDGYWNTSTTRITQHANVAAGTLYNYFENKEELIDEVFTQIRSESLKYVLEGYPDDGTVKECFEHIWFRYIDWGVKNPERYKLLLQIRISNLISTETRERRAEDLDIIYNLFERGVADGLFSRISSRYFSAHFQANIGAAMSYAISAELRDMKLVKHISTGFEMFWQGAIK